MYYEALAHGRFQWKRPGGEFETDYDIERRLTRSGWSVILDGEIIPVARVTWAKLNEVKEMTALDGSGRHVMCKYGDVYKVTPADDLIRAVSATETILRDSLNTQIILSRIPKITLADAAAAEAVDVALNAAYTGSATLPLVKLPAGSELPTTISLSDGEIHTPELSQAHALNLVTAAQALGIHTADVIKAERLLSDEVEALSEVVELVAECELSEREKVARALGLEVRATAKRTKEKNEESESEEDERAEIDETNID